jgi:hypothetical protein
MEARKLIDGASLGPEALKALGQAFDEAWASIASDVGSDPTMIKGARMRLAAAILSIADDSSRDVSVLRDAALKSYKKTR